MSHITAIVSLYHPSATHADHAALLAAQADRLILCDNSPDSHEALFSFLGDKAHYLPNRQNLGLSAAFNRVLKDERFAWQDDDFVIFFDQDSVVPEGHIEKLVDTYNRLAAQGHDLGCLGPVYFNTSNQREEVPIQKEMIDGENMQVSSIITTSMLCKYGALKQIGFWNEEVFLDMADWDVCWRFTAAGKEIILSYVSVLRHSVGEGKKKVGPIELRVGRPFREYYQTRDCLYLLKKKYVPFKFKARFVAMVTVRPILHVLFLEEKKQRLHYMLKGIHDYKKGFRGALRE
ncbi:MAG: glycosyltransferase [Clostridia bacterium]|nr:glycosyltransferase [Clostridia bacterium]